MSYGFDEIHQPQEPEDMSSVALQQHYKIAMPTEIGKWQSVAMVTWHWEGNPAAIKVHFQTLYSETNCLTENLC